MKKMLIGLRNQIVNWKVLGNIISLNLMMLDCLTKKKVVSEGVLKAKITCGDRLTGYRKYEVLSFDMNSIKGNQVTSGGTECIGLDGLDSAHKGYFPQNGNSTANLPTKDNTVSDQTGPPIAALQLSVKDESARESESPVAVGDGSSSSQDGNASFNVCCDVWDWLRGERGQGCVAYRCNLCCCVQQIILKLLPSSAAIPAEF
ncbi:uncharacterized protein LOC131256703 [Magnolia sinica]|uniref:uncharacterized protein LOC131256703 n=1 Tax=Magnolia sinica TaxID=86752 RepID=UPI0026584DA1|nr:uncharacterized protein LOC131256703 [Magnolia sinica]